MILPKFVQDNASPYHVDYMRTFLKRVDVSGTRVLEIGSDYYLASARLLRANGAKEVISTNLGDWRSPDPLPEGVQFRVVDASATGFPDGVFDLIYGIAILEHIPDMERICLEMCRMLKPGGKAFLQGCPFWTCSIGHHVWYDKHDGTLYAFNASSNPIANWSHLVLSPTELATDLAKRNVPSDDASKIVDYVFDLSGMSTGSASNRVPPTQIMGCLARHFRVEVIEDQRDTTPQNEFYALARRTFDEVDLKTMGLAVLLEK